MKEHELDQLSRSIANRLEGYYNFLTHVAIGAAVVTVIAGCVFIPVLGIYGFIAASAMGGLLMLVGLNLDPYGGRSPHENMAGWLARSVVRPLHSLARKRRRDKKRVRRIGLNAIAMSAATLLAHVVPEVPELLMQTSILTTATYLLIGVTYELIILELTPEPGYNGVWADAARERELHQDDTAPDQNRLTSAGELDSVTVSPT